MKISEAEFARICEGLKRDRESIVKHNPIGTEGEIMLWMLLSCLASYLSLSETETPCFNGKPDAKTYRDAVLFVMKDRKANDFDVNRYLDDLAAKLG
jgi:hypothetical protein